MVEEEEEEGVLLSSEKKGKTGVKDSEKKL